ncbi:hypothetical protein [[Enterobacter] lignolyticus]|uniref:Periplasmic protein n=1 Tax=[Enterobacter] lignolyticus TaxID=1334193 RepID=A0A806X1V5_9ENTR|nr:hypothetical protein [[Enterobacter] lignolyticus]ALR75270.1 hypothetical protein AO703_02805 [[Enterobacter] lignolyticus]
MKFPTIVLGLSSFIFSGMTLAAETTMQPEAITSALNLNKEQKSELIKLHASAEQCMNNIDAGKYQPKLFLEMIKKGQVDDAVFTQQITIQNELHTQAAHCRITYYTSISNMLTKAQKQKLLEMYQKGQ